MKNKTLAIAMVGFYGALSQAGDLRESLGGYESKSLTVTMTNTAPQNKIEVFDSNTHALLQTLPTGGEGGASGNARGIRQVANKLFAAVNFGSQTVSIFKRRGNRLEFVKEVTTTSAPVSIDFGNHHMYVAGSTTVDSFLMDGDNDRVFFRDGSANLLLAEGGLPPVGSTAQVGALNKHVLVTLKSDPTPGTVDVVSLDESGAVKGSVTAVAGPAKSLTPFGFTVTGPDSALITLAHSGEVGLFRDGAFKSVIKNGGQAGPCWTTKAGRYVLVANTGSKTLSREFATGSNLFIDSNVAATITSGGNPTDLDTNESVAAVLDSTGTASHLSFFKMNYYGELQPQGAAVDLGTPHANGVAVMAPTH